MNKFIITNIFTIQKLFVNIATFFLVDQPENILNMLLNAKNYLKFFAKFVKKKFPVLEI